jgi:hypothetical protein
LLLTHPRQFAFVGQDEDVNTWSIMESPGELVNFVCCQTRKINDFAKNIGAGPTLLLLNMKSWIWLLVIASILSSIPCSILASGRGLEGTHYTDSGLVAKVWSFTLGNIGEQ